MKRRKLLKTMVALTATAGVGYFFGRRYWDGFLVNPCKNPIPKNLRDSEFWESIWQGLNAKNIWDCHVHSVGLGDSDSGVWVNPALQSLKHPLQHLQYQFYLNASCATDPNIDVSVVERMLQQLEEAPRGYKAMLLAFDYHHSDKGKSLPSFSTFYVPNEYPRKLAEQYPEHFEWIASIHPYRDDAIDALQQAKAQGARAVKWLPPAQNMDPLDPRCQKYFSAMADLKLPLLTHAGLEKAVKGADTHELGNPLRLRAALDEGVKVIVAHCSSLGKNLDMDMPNPQPVSSFSLFERLMNNDRYKENLVGDISACLQVNRNADVLQTLLTRTDWHDRLLHGSDYPLPAVMPLVSLNQLVRFNLLNKKWLKPLNELRQYNALLFDFATKRLLKFNGNQFSSKVFETKPFFKP